MVGGNDWRPIAARMVGLRTSCVLPGRDGPLLAIDEAGYAPFRFAAYSLSMKEVEFRKID